MGGLVNRLFWHDGDLLEAEESELSKLADSVCLHLTLNFIVTL